MLVYVRGAGDIATGVAARLVRSGVSVVMADIAVPTCIRRTICFCEAIRLGEVEVEGIRARLAQTPAEALAITEAGDVAVVVDPQAKMLGELKPVAVVDAILAIYNFLKLSRFRLSTRASTIRTGSCSAISSSILGGKSTVWLGL